MQMISTKIKMKRGMSKRKWIWRKSQKEENWKRMNVNKAPQKKKRNYTKSVANLNSTTIKLVSFMSKSNNSVCNLS